MHRPIPRRRSELHHSALHPAAPHLDHGRSHVAHRFEAGLVLLVFCVALAWAIGLAWTVRHPKPLEVAALTSPTDRDGDGLLDRTEDELLARYAPRPILATDDPSFPANIGWIRERAHLTPSGLNFMGAIVAREPFSVDVRRGSKAPSDWTVYGHAYPRADGGVELQYWFYYPYNEGPLFFDHDSDWEHVSVELGPDLEPTSFALSAHNDNAPGRRFPWASIPRDGGHPYFLVAAGTHAAYLRPSDAPFWERLAPCGTRPDGAVDPRQCSAVVWQPGAPGANGSPLVNVGERGHGRLEGEDASFFLTYAGLWGSAVPPFGSAAPYGPPFQRGFCVDARTGSCR